MYGRANIDGDLRLGGGAQFWVYLSPQNDTAKTVKNWSVTFSQGNWSDSITSKNPTKKIRTPNLSGIFQIKITESDPSPEQPLEIEIPPMDGGKNEIGCNANCASMVGIVADKNPRPGQANAKFWTIWDALCALQKPEL